MDSRTPPSLTPDPLWSPRSTAALPGLCPLRAPPALQPPATCTATPAWQPYEPQPPAQALVHPPLPPPLPSPVEFHCKGTRHRGNPQGSREITGSSCRSPVCPPGPSPVPSARTPGVAQPPLQLAGLRGKLRAPALPRMTGLMKRSVTFLYTHMHMEMF